MDNLNNVSTYAPYLFMTEAEFQLCRPPFKPNKFIVTEDLSGFTPIFDANALSNAYCLIDVVLQTAQDTLCRNDAQSDPQLLRALLRNIGVQTKVSQGGLMYGLRAALTGTTVRFLTAVSKARRGLTTQSRRSAHL